MRNRRSKSNIIRIIGGTLRSRQISFLDNPQLRPTPDRVRETLFNWLSPFLQDAECLDLFAGSGALAFEAISRGAKKVLALEKNPVAAQLLKQQAQQLKIQNVEILEMDCRVFLKGTPQPFDILFIDPPYQTELLSECFALLEGALWLKPNALIYFESNKPIPVEKIPKDWEIIREKRAGKVYFYLAKSI